MGKKHNIKQLNTTRLSCIYDKQTFASNLIKKLLADDAQRLFANAEQIYETSNATSYKVQIKNQTYFMKKLKIKKGRKALMNMLMPSCKSCFHAAYRLLDSGIHTPKALLAAIYGTEHHQVLITEYIEGASNLDEYIINASPAKRAIILPELAKELARFYSKGFYSRHLRSANIMVFKDDSKRVYTFIDLEKMGSNKLSGTGTYISTISRACFEFYFHLSKEEQHHLLRLCFDAGIKYNIFHKPSQIDSFIKKTAKQIKKRRQ